MESDDRPVKSMPQSLPVLRWWWVAAVAAIAVVVTVLAMWLLLSRLINQPNVSLASAELDAIRTSLGIGVGAGGAFALWLAVRRQRSTELQLAETARIAGENKLHLERVAVTTEEDLRERRITELYTKAVEQLGSDKAPVRLGGLYALERLAEGNVGHQQTVVNVICAYLKMPFSVPARARLGYPLGDITTSDEEIDVRYEELQVRLAAQRILSSHLHIKPDRDPRKSSGGYWPNIELDLAGSILIDLRLQGCRIASADFSHAKFLTVARFDGTTFDGPAWFFHSKFQGANAFFHGVHFGDRAVFTASDFGLLASFRKVQFGKSAYFARAKFRSIADFTEANFLGDVIFENCTFDNITANVAKETWPPAGFDFDNAKIRNGSSSKIALPDGWGINQTDDNVGILILRTTSAGPQQSSLSKGGEK